ncbi:MAG: SMI1/KNR4 family protein [Myxococcota bacterium]|nr:SMI1/KNR4 family protein [Myxococcota bacterium]
MNLELYEQWCGSNGGFNQLVTYTGDFEELKAIKAAGKKKLSWQVKKGNKKARVVLMGSQPDLDFVEAVKETAKKMRQPPPLLIDEEEVKATLLRPFPWFAERWYARAGGNSETMALVDASKKELDSSYSLGYQLVYASVGEPATPEAIAATEQRLGVTFDEALEDLYLQADGILLGARYWLPEDKASGNPLAPPREPIDPGVDSRFFMDPSPDNKTFWMLEGSDVSEWSFGALCVPPLAQLESWESYYGISAPSKLHEELVIFDACYGYNPAFLRFGAGRLKVYGASDHGADPYDIKMDVIKYLSEGSTDVRGNRRTWWRA